MHARSRAAVCAAAIAAVSGTGCGRIGYDLLSILGPTDAGVDAGAEADTGVPDAAAGDAGTPTDAGEPPVDAAVDAAIPFCEEDPCKLVLPQCGCPEGEACQRTVFGQPTRECVPPGDVERDEPCSQSIQCVTGHTCVGIAPPDGICSRYCTASAECGAPSECIFFAVPGEGIGACTAICDPVLDAGCPVGYGCHLITAQRVDDDAFVPVTICGPDTGDVEGEACAQICAPGFICLGDSLCYELCVVGDASTCSDGAAACASFASPQIIAGVEYGFCQ